MRFFLQAAHTNTLIMGKVNYISICFLNLISTVNSLVESTLIRRCCAAGTFFPTVQISGTQPNLNPNVQGNGRIILLIKRIEKRPKHNKCQYYRRSHINLYCKKMREVKLISFCKVSNE